MTDLVRALKLNHSTCYVLIMSFVKSGYLHRTHDKNYIIGHRFVTIGRIASERFSPLQVAQPEMRALADEFGAICSAFFLEGDELVVSSRAVSIAQLGFSFAQGARLQLRPPFNALYFAWSAPAQARTQAWIDHVDPSPTAAQREQMVRATDFAREQGFLFGVRNSSVAPHEEGSGQIFEEQCAECSVTLECQIDPERRYPLSFIHAPVFDEQQAVIFTLALTGFTGLFRGGEVERMGRSLRDACDRITGFAGLRMPP